MNFCTTADNKYLAMVLALHKSLTDNVMEFTLHYLALDDDAYYKCKSLKLPNIKAYKLSAFEKVYAELETAKDNPASKYGTQYSQYCWTLTPWFTNYILKTIPENEYLFYIDSDIYLYGSPKIILNEMNGSSVGIHTHRFTLPFKNMDTGWYNVGIVVFKNDMEGRFASEAWKGWLLNPDNKYYEKYGTCGDQKYLELFPKIAKDVCIFDQNILHGAPWCCNDLNGKAILWYHFSHFVYDDKGYKDHVKNPPEWKPTAHGFIKPYYDNYYSVLMEMENKINEGYRVENILSHR